MAAPQQMPPSEPPLSARAESPLDVIDQAHRRKRALCDILEEIADDLPKPNRVLCLRAAAQLTIEVPVHHADEDLGLFPLLRARCLPEDRIDPVLDRLGDEHLDDEATMEDVVTLLRIYAAGEIPATSGAAAGYALRGFFEGQRRHVAWEDATVMPLARVRFTAADLEHLAAAMERNRSGPRPSALRRANAERTQRSGPAS